MNESSIPYGLWPSPIRPLSLARGGSLVDVQWAREGPGAGSLVWLENRPERSVVVIRPPDEQAPRDLNSEFSVRGRVGYGGGGFTVGHGTVYFVDGASGRIFRQPLEGGPARPVTPPFGQAGAPALSPDGRWLVFIHTLEGQDCLAIVDAEGLLWPQKLASGADFFMQPAWHPQGEGVAWIDWNHPNMPWDGTRLRLGHLSFPAQGLPYLKETSTLAGDENIAIFQPEFSPDGRFLAYVSDANGWGQLYLYDLEKDTHRLLTKVPAEHGAPAWVQGVRTYGFGPTGECLYFLRSQAGQRTLGEVELAKGRERRLALEGYTHLDQIAIAPGENSQAAQVALLASGPATPARLILASVPRKARRGPSQVQIIRRATAEELPSGAYSQPEPIQWAGMDGGQVYGLFYPPHNPGFTGQGLPPLIIHVHGGPTSQADSGFNLEAQFFTSRGYAFLDVNFRGSTGYGRAYQDALRGKWGIYDVQDAVSGARALVEAGRVDEKKLVILGGSSGGYTVFQALVDYPGFFKAGISRYGVANQFSLAADTHKFEAHYSDRLLGPLPEAAALYRQRSPLFFADRIRDPVAIFQGEDDNVVPPSQAESMVAALRRQGVAYLYHLYPGEGHGFRKPETIEHFYAEVERFLREKVIYA